MNEERMRNPSEHYQSNRETNPGDPSNRNRQEDVMNQDQIKGRFDQLKGKIKQTWGRLTDDEIALYNGKRDQFLGKLQEKYGLMRNDAEEQIEKLEESYRSNKAA